MNKAELLARIEQIKTEMDNAIKQHTALVSHLSECSFWLANFEKLEAENAVILPTQDEATIEINATIEDKIA